MTDEPETCLHWALWKPATDVIRFENDGETFDVVPACGQPRSELHNVVTDVAGVRCLYCLDYLAALGRQAERRLTKLDAVRMPDSDSNSPMLVIRFGPVLPTETERRHGHTEATLGISWRTAVIACEQCGWATRPARIPKTTYLGFPNDPMVMMRTAERHHCERDARAKAREVARKLGRSRKKEGATEPTEAAVSDIVEAPP